jgi:hypothetical protein
MPSVYRLKHLPTGLYFCPSRELKVKILDHPDVQYRNGIYIKSNLSTTGKSYIKKPSFKNIGSNFYTHIITSYTQLNGRKYLLLPFIDHEWIIDEVE